MQEDAVEFGPLQALRVMLSRSFQKETNWGSVVSKRRQGHLGRLEKKMAGLVFGSGLLARIE